jgi:hypothetical protein
MSRSPQLALRVVAAVALVVIGYGHFNLWQNGYKHTPVDQMFLLCFAAGIVLGLLALVGPRRIAGLLGAGFALLTFAAFALSRGPGVPTFNGTFKEHGYLSPTAGLHLFGLNIALTLMIAEGVAVVVCAALVLSAAKAPAGRLSRRPAAA